MSLISFRNSVVGAQPFLQQTVTARKFTYRIIIFKQMLSDFIGFRFQLRQSF